MGSEFFRKRFFRLGPLRFFVLVIFFTPTFVGTPAMARAAHQNFPTIGSLIDTYKGYILPARSPGSVPLAPQKTPAQENTDKSAQTSAFITNLNIQAVASALTSSVASAYDSSIASVSSWFNAYNNYISGLASIFFNPNSPTIVAPVIPPAVVKVSPTVTPTTPVVSIPSAPI